jgi:hypothetical protein
MEKEVLVQNTSKSAVDVQVSFLEHTDNFFVSTPDGTEIPPSSAKTFRVINRFSLSLSLFFFSFFLTLLLFCLSKIGFRNKGKFEENSELLTTIFFEVQSLANATLLPMLLPFTVRIQRMGAWIEMPREIAGSEKLEIGVWKEPLSKTAILQQELPFYNSSESQRCISLFFDK